MKSVKGKIDNPLSDLISDDIYELLDSYDLIDEKAVRNYQIKKRYREMRKLKNFSSTEAIEVLREDYPYLQFDTIRKIVYELFKKENPQNSKNC